MKHLLEKWSKLEPQICEDLYGQTIRLHLPDDSSYSIYPLVDELPTKELARIQWTIQQAIIEKKWWLSIGYKGSWDCLIYFLQNGNYATVTTIDHISATEALLTAYLKVLEAHATTKES